MNNQPLKIILKGNAGFTIIELLVSIFILTIGIIGVVNSVPMSMQIQKTGQMTASAIQLGQAKIEQVISESYDDISTGTVSEAYGFSTHFPSFRRRTEITSFNPNNPGVAPPQDMGIKKISVSVFWKSPLSIMEKEAKLVTLFAQR